jgi:hypothetical protein
MKQEGVGSVIVPMATQICAWCLGDLRPVEDVPTLQVCVYCGRAVSFRPDVMLSVPHTRPPVSLLIEVRTEPDEVAARPRCAA